MKALLPLLLALTACGDKPCDTAAFCDSGPDTPHDGNDDSLDSGKGSADSQSDTDTDHPFDTAFGSAWFFGQAETDVGAFVTGEFGFRAKAADGRTLCDYLSVWADDGLAPPGGCPDCDWAFELTLSDGTATGAECASVGMSITGSYWDGFTASWGFSSTTTYDYHGTEYSIASPAVWYYDTYSASWLVLAYDGVDSYVTGDASDMTFAALAETIYYYP